MSTQTRLVLGAMAAALLAIITAYLIGLSTGSAQLETQRQLYTEQYQDIMAELADTQEALAVAQAANYLVAARGHLYRVALELDRRNFGNAEAYLKQASTALQQVNLQAAGVNPAAFDAVTQALTRTSIIITADSEFQRNQVLRIAEQVEALIPQR